LEEIEGVLIDIIYQNEINSYLIGVLETENEEITIVGYMPFISMGDSLKLIGKYVEHKEYGTQFKVETFEKTMPQTLEALEIYLAKGDIKGIGPATAKKIINAFGKDTIEIIKYNPKKLAIIKGITEEKALQISESFMENLEVWQIVGFLRKFNIGPENAQKVYKLLGENAINEIESNPYILIDIAREVDFKQIDKMALDLGIEYNNEKRVQSGIKYGLLKIAYNGNACVLKQNLVEYVSNLLGVQNKIIEDNIINLNVKKDIAVEKRDEEEWIYIYSFYKGEEDIANKLIKLDKAKNLKKINHINSELEKTEQHLDFILSEKQLEAIKAVNDNNVTVITGGPGTGKTTIIKSIIEIFKSKKYKVVLAAPTGRAAKRMTETTGEEACTLHRLLEIGKTSDENIFKKNMEVASTPIDADVIIVDEVSMVDMFLMHYLLKSIYLGTKLVLVGDSDQLPSVGPGDVLEDIINSKKITTIHLDKIFRQAAKSKIIVNAHKVNNGEEFISNIKDMNEDFFYIKENNPEIMQKQIISLCTGRLKKYGDYDFFEDIQVLTPTKKGALGTRELNKILQENLNPSRNRISEKVSGNIVYRVGDRVMQIKNNYDIFWEKNIEKYETGTGVFNGEIGTITKIDEINRKMQIMFDDGKVSWYEFSELDQIEHSYCITIHKAQRK
jgi:exodeoxyribonuclease V alpha subunit